MARVLLILLLLTSAATAGPWPRAEGEGFLSFSLDLDAIELEDNFVSFYLEYGLSRDRTLVIDRQERGDEIAKTFALIRFPIGAPDRKLKLAYDLGIGAVDDHVALRVGLSVGRGWSIVQKSGWWTLDSRALLFDDGENGIVESDITFGVQLTQRLKVISQLQTGVPSEGDPYAKVAQSLVYQTSKTRHYLLGVTSGLYEADEIQINIGLWQEF
ncbi:MAG: hypothetical protein AAFY25_06830 [Pseudomonadota bacterium]